MIQHKELTASTRKNVEEIEHNLQELFSPIRPNQEFVNHLYYRLNNPPSVVMETASPKGALLVMSIGMCVGVFLFWFLRRLR